MKNILSYYIVGFILLAGIASCSSKKSGIPDLRERYGLSNTLPFGAYTAHQILQNIYPEQVINLSNKKFATFYNDIDVDSGSLYINISNKYLLSEEDASALLKYVHNGNTAFIAAEVIDSNFMLRLSTNITSNPWLENIDGALFKKTSISLLPDELSTKDSFSYFYKPFSNYFSNSDGDKSRITGYGKNGNANFLVFFWGKGRLYLHCEPKAFSNYFLLTDNNYLYMTQIMQMIEEKPTGIYWDEYYNKINFNDNNQNDASAIGALLKHIPLANAFWLLVILLLLYILINGKRKQRVVPIIKPIENTSVAFTAAVAGLYMAENNNKNIADKLITYFNEYIRNRYFLHMYAINNDQVSLLSRKSGVSAEQVKALYEHIQFINNNNEVSDTALLTLNQHIQNFYKKKL
ncbi:MAG: DUF4350 domain-containing protein [Ferruginibacter sp.]